MKATTTILALALTLTTAAPALAAEQSTLSRHAVYRAELTRYNVDQSLPYADSVVGGNVTVDQAAGEVTLTLFRKPHCPMGAMCYMLIMPVTIQLPAKSAVIDSCGNRVIEAERNLLMVDGDLERLTVIDHTKNRCPTFVAQPDTEIRYETQGRLPAANTTSTFDAGRLTKAFIAE